MIFLNFLRISLSWICIQSCLSAHEGEISYVKDRDVIVKWSSAEQYNESLGKFFNKEDVVSEIMQKKKEYETSYTDMEANDEYSCWKNYPQWRDNIGLGSVFTGGILTGLLGLMSFEYDPAAFMIFSIPGLMGGTFVALGTQKYFDTYYSDKGFLPGESQEDALRRKVGKDINQKLYDKGYLTKNWLYPISGSEKIRDHFLERVLKSDTLQEIVVNEY